MKVVVQRAKNASVTVEDQVVGAIDDGLVLLVGLTHDDTLADLEYCAKKVANLRIFEDEFGKMNRSVQDVAGAILSISQFTLYGETKKGIVQVSSKRQRRIKRSRCMISLINY